MRLRTLLLSSAFGVAAFAVFHEDPVKASTGLALRIYLSAMDSVYGERVSTELMQRCIAQDTTTFDAGDLSDISSNHLAVVSSAIHAELVNLSDPENHSVVKDARIFTPFRIDEVFQKIEPRLAAVAGILETGNGKIVLNTLDSRFFIAERSDEDLLDKVRPDYQGYHLNELGIVADFSRAIGTFTLSCVDHHCSIVDYFDFEVDDRSTKIQTISKAYRLYRSGRFDDAARSVGQMFCQEGEDERPTDTSIPIRIEFELP